MFRLIGFLLGSALSIGALILLLGLPKLTALSKPEVLEQLEPIAQQATEIMEELVELAKVPGGLEEVPGTLDTANDFEDVEPAKAPGTLNEVPGTVVMVDDPEEPTIVSELLVPATVAEVPGTMQWQAFWNPFRSEIAANGFVAQLERVTGLDYRVVRIKPGRYEVAFAFLNDAERRTKLSQIEAATGLELSQ